MFRFTIRDVLWLMVVVGLAVGWFAHWRSWKANRPPEFVLRELEELSAKVARQQETIRKLLGVKDGGDSVRAIDDKPHPHPRQYAPPGSSQDWGAMLSDDGVYPK